MGSGLGSLFAIDMAIQWSLWAVAAALKTEKFYDLAGSSTFGLLVAMSYRNSSGHLRQKIQTAMVATWAARLGLFLFGRVMKQGSDSRFDKVKNQPGTFLMYWTVQGLWVMVTLLPTLMLNSSRQNPPLCSLDYLGWALWASGFLLEVVADEQKRRFRLDPSNTSKWIESGVWSCSRHPNYLGEIMLWAGLFTSASAVFSGWQWASLGSPLFVAYLLTKVSGIPILERQAHRRWGTIPAFMEYRKRTAVLVPWIW
ncbi:uncharacterized protein LOC135825589 [Sycon ciliatum]|uniref:uncharacterized protein LOC135825589 n=1 Tax=Sycon ciliatum TaxID=27933 RepID=UPI0020AC3F36|eukprot:scpid97700/ scgid22482/ 